MNHRRKRSVCRAGVPVTFAPCSLAPCWYCCRCSACSCCTVRNCHHAVLGSWRRRDAQKWAENDADADADDNYDGGGGDVRTYDTAAAGYHDIVRMRTDCSATMTMRNTLTSAVRAGRIGEEVSAAFSSVRLLLLLLVVAAYSLSCQSVPTLYSSPPPPLSPPLPSWLPT